MIYPIIVAYNKYCGDSPTCEAVKKSGLSAIVCDNSTKDYGNEKYCIDNGFHYISMNGNKGLSKAYNKSIDYLMDKEGYAVILDDDTDLPVNFFSEIEKETLINPEAKLILPVVYSNSLIISPCIKRGIRVVPPSALEELSHNEVSAINSGMVIALNYLKDYRYDENLFLDYIDHDFMDSFRRSGEKSVIAENIVLNQNFFGMTNKNKQALKIRYNIFKKDFMYYVKKTGADMFIARLILLKRKFKIL